jgi:hypothetical protein
MLDPVLGKSGAHVEIACCGRFSEIPGTVSEGFLIWYNCRFLWDKIHMWNSQHLCNIGYMPVSGSNRVVVEIDRALKARLYAALALDSCTLKEWFRESVETFLHSKDQKSRAVTRSKKSKGSSK